ncbi:MAG: AraC family transcriptional regulator [Marinifilaceae bacterium]
MEIHPFKNDRIQLSVDKISFKNPYDFFKVHRHSYYEIFLFEKGCGGVQMIDFDECNIEDKTLFIVSPNQVHLLKRMAREDGILLQFTMDYLETSIHLVDPNILFTLRENTFTQLNDSDFNKLLFLFQQLREIYDSNDSYRQEKLQHFFAFTIFHVLDVLQKTNLQPVKDNLCLQFQKLAENNFKNNRNISFYAEQLNVSKNKLSAQVNANLGITPLQYLHELLKVEIRRLVLIEQLSHKEISHFLGFDSQSSYSRFVKKKLGCNPRELSRSFQIHK